MEDQSGAQQLDAGIVGLHAIHGLLQRLLVTHRVGAARQGGTDQAIAATAFFAVLLVTVLFVTG